MKLCRSRFSLIRPISLVCRFAQVIAFVIPIFGIYNSTHAEKPDGLNPKAQIVLDRKQTSSGPVISVRIAVPNGTGAKIFGLDGPPRIVVDVPGARLKRNDTLTVPSNGVVGKIRLGSHPDKVRMVLDLVTESLPHFTTKSGAGHVTIDIADVSSNTQAGQTPTPHVIPTRPHPEATATSLSTDRKHQPTIEPTAEPTISTETPKIPTQQPEKTAQPTPSSTKSGALKEGLDHKTPVSIGTPPAQAPTQPPLTATPTVTVARPTPTVIPTATQKGATPVPARTITATPTESNGAQEHRLLAVPTGTPASGLVGDLDRFGGELDKGNQDLTLMAYKFDYLQPGRMPVLKIVMNRDRIPAEISKVDSKTYRIAVPACTLATSQLTLPQFPPADFVGFSMVVAQQVENRVEMTVTVDQGVRLGIFVRNSEIWVKRL